MRPALGLLSELTEVRVARVLRVLSCVFGFLFRAGVAG